MGSPTTAILSNPAAAYDERVSAPPIDDPTLLREWAAGDERAGRDFYRRHCDRIAAFLARKFDGDVADLVQRVFLSCLQATRKGTVLDDPRAFLYAIARNELYDALAARHREAVRFDPGVTSLRQLGPSPTSVLASDERQRLLHDALERIPLDAQLALELYYFEELPMAAVATALGVTRSAALNRVHRARAALRERIEQAPATPARAETLQDLQAWAPPDPDGAR
jgi:RNA polymerase sigma factor (sigma-70 family)